MFSAKVTQLHRIKGRALRSQALLRSLKKKLQYFLIPPPPVAANTRQRFNATARTLVTTAHIYQTIHKIISLTLLLTCYSAFGKSQCT
jgi:hypothetical protein